MPRTAENQAGAQGTRPRAPWEAFELLVVAGAAASAITIGGYIAEALITYLPGTTIGLLLNATAGWSVYVSLLLVTVVALLWWEANRWAEAISEEVRTPGTEPDDDGDLGPDEHGAEQDGPDEHGADEDGALDPAFREAVAHLFRLRRLNVGVSTLLLITAAAGLARPIGIVLWTISSSFGEQVVDVAWESGAALVIAIAGLVVARWTSRLCRWWDQVPGVAEEPTTAEAPIAAEDATVTEVDAPQ